MDYHPKIAIMGTGNIGSKLFETLRNQYPHSEIVMYNRESPKGIAAAVSNDQSEGIMRRIRRHESNGSTFIFTTNAEEALRGADIVVVTAGVPRKSASQSRTELAKDNIPVIDEIAEAAGKIAREPDAHQTTYIIATNPIGLIDQRFQEKSGIPHDRIMGLSGELDVERLRQSIRTHMKVGYDDIRGERVIGDHGPNMVPVLSQIEIRRDGHWQKLTDLPDFAHHEKELREATVKGGGRLTGWAGQSDFRGPAAALALMIEQIVDARWGDQSQALPVTASVYAPVHGIYSGQTVRINKDGTHSVAEMPSLSDAEQQALKVSVEKAQEDKHHFDNIARLAKATGTDERAFAFP